ncbi:MAG: LysR family transcriptional regulator [Pseudomonas sp.]|nr:LysR family transcriptional regulator [Pseudomonas sp.]
MSDSFNLPPLNALKAFEASARLQSISLAAKELHVTHGAISRQVKQLEEHLGITLLSKHGRGIKLTDAGMRLYQSSHEAFTQIHQSCVDIKRQTQQSPFVLACPGSLLARWLIPRLEQLQHDLPHLRLQVITSSGDDNTLQQSDADASLVFLDQPCPETMQAYTLDSERIGPVLSPLYQRASELRSAPAAELLKEPLLFTRSRPQAWPQWAQAQQLATADLTYAQGFEHLYYLLEAAVAGLGVAIAPEHLVRSDIANGRLIAPWGFVETSAKLVLLTRKKQHKQRAQQLAQWLINSL